MKMSIGCKILIAIALFTLVVFRFTIFGFFMVLLEIGLYGAGLVGIDRQKADAYLANKYDEENKK